MNFKKFNLLILSVTILGLFSGCDPDPKPIPNPWASCAKLGLNTYQCQPNNSPGILVIDGKGTVTLDVLSDNAPQFGQVTKYLPSNFSLPQVTPKLGSGNTKTHKIAYSGSGSNVYFDVPMTGSYSIKAYYIEYGNQTPTLNGSTGNTAITCNNPAPNKCFRWYKMISLADGYYPSCNSNPYTITINTQDPTGFVGSCN